MARQWANRRPESERYEYSGAGGVASQWRWGASEHGGLVICCQPPEEKKLSEPPFIFISFVALSFHACSGAAMEMKKRVGLELRSRSPEQVSHCSGARTV